MSEPPRVLASGANEVYRWLVSKHTQEEFLKLCSFAVAGRYIAVTACDSGPLQLSQEETNAGWKAENGIAYSPRVDSTVVLPTQMYDEWYVFREPQDLGQVSRFEGNIFDPPLKKGQLGLFVNYHLALHRTDLSERPLTDLFWFQIGWIQPESYVSDSDFLTFVSRDHTLFEAVLRTLSGSPK